MDLLNDKLCICINSTTYFKVMGVLGGGVSVQLRQNEWDDE